MSTELDKQAAETTVLIGKFLGECFKLRGLPRVVKDLESIMPTMQLIIEEQFQAFASQVREQSIAECAAKSINLDLWANLSPATCIHCEKKTSLDGAQDCGKSPTTYHQYKIFKSDLIPRKEATMNSSESKPSCTECTETEPCPSHTALNDQHFPTQHSLCGQSQRDRRLLEGIENTSIIYYGPQPCDLCGKNSIARGSAKQGFGDLRFEYPRDIIYPNHNWTLHVCPGHPLAPHRAKESKCR